MSMTKEERDKEMTYHKAIQQGKEIGIKACVEKAEEYLGCSANDVIKALYQLQERGL